MDISREFTRCWSRLTHTVVFIIATISISSSTLLAFAPGGFKQYPFSKTHVEITEEALQSVYTSVGLTTITNSMKAARKEFTTANKDVDDLSPASSAHHFDAENFTDGQTLINDLLSQAVAQVKSGDFSGARTSVGQTLHTVQDFYSHSNWVELGNTAPSSELGRSGSISNVSPPSDAACAKVIATCNVKNLITKKLTSGYYGGQDRKIDQDGNVSKCRHGGFFDSGPDSHGATTEFERISGINKDSGVCLITGAGLVDSPHSDFNPIAATVAVGATVQIFDDLKSKMTSSEFKALLGVGPSLGFAIDTTGSMGSIIAGVRSAAISIVNSRLGTDEEPSKYVLIPFNDPGVGPSTVTADPVAFKSAISGLFASGGDDCPELSMAGTLRAVDLSDERGSVFVFTDASSKDASLFPSISALASKKNVKIFFALFGSCSPVDPAYFSVANASGGQVFTLSSFEASTITKLSDILAKNNSVDVESRQGSVTGTQVTIPFIVDSTMTKLNVSFSRIDSITGSVTMTLIRPDGVIVPSVSSGNVTTLPLSSGQIYSVTTPQIGIWKAVIGGEGQYSLLVNGESSLALDEFSFAKLGGRPGHQGYYATSGLPLIGTVTKAVARVSGEPTSVSFEFRDLSGNRISPLSLSDSNGETNYLIGDVTIPNQSFRVYAFGTDASGLSFQRLIATIIFPQSVEVNPPAAVGLGQGQPTTYIFQVRNHGPSGTFNFKATDTAGFVTNVTPASANISTGQSVLVKVTLTVFPFAPIGTRDSVTMTATSASNVAINNFAVLTSSVVSAKVAGDVTGDGVVNCGDLNLVRASFGSQTGARSFNPDVDVDISGTIDIRDLAFVARRIPAGTVCK